MRRAKSTDCTISSWQAVKKSAVGVPHPNIRFGAAIGCGVLASCAAGSAWKPWPGQEPGHLFLTRLELLAGLRIVAGHLFLTRLELLKGAARAASPTGR
jgi:hypothetical protein